MVYLPWMQTGELFSSIDLPNKLLEFRDEKHWEDSVATFFVHPFAKGLVP
jgi:hypothetical protein